MIISRMGGGNSMDVDITGARIFFDTPINLPVLGQLRITETMLVSWLYCWW